MQSLQMKEGKLLVRYFGVPLRTQKLTGNDCSVLIGKISNKIDSWVAKKAILCWEFATNLCCIV